MKTFKIAVVWEQFLAGGVDTYLAELINSWPNHDDHFTIYTNHRNSGEKRLKELLKADANVRIVYVSSHFINSFQLSPKLAFRIFRAPLKPILFVLSILMYKKYLADGEFDILIGQNGGYPASLGVLSGIFAAAWIGIKVRVLVVHHQANQANHA